MKKYIEIAKSAMKIHTAYAAWYWAGTFAAIVQLLVLYYFWHAVYANRSSIADMSLEMMLTYMVIAMLMSEYVSGAGNELARDIKLGNIAIELLRPYTILYKLVAIDMGVKVTSIIRSSLPMFIVGVLFIGVQFPSSFEGTILFLISALLGILLGTQIDLMIGILAFWTVNIWGLSVFKESIIRFFSGALIPISLFPSWFRTFSQFLPFQSMIYVPVSIYTGAISGNSAYIAIGIQIFWLIFTFIAIKLSWHYAVKKVTIFGG